jgi:ankyrin repeat protein
LQEAQEVLGEVCVAYLNFSDFETQVTAYVDNHVTSGMAAIERIVAKTDLSLPKTGSLDAISLFNRMVYSKLKATNIEYSRHIPKNTEPVEHLLKDYRLLGYVRENWLWHTASFPLNDLAKTRRDELFHNLVLQKQLPFTFRPWNAYINTKMTYPYIEAVGWALTMNHCQMMNTLLKTDPIFKPVTYFEDAGRWVFEDRINTYISRDIVERLEYCAQDTWDSKSIPAQGWLYSRMLNACRRGHLNALLFCIPRLSVVDSSRATAIEEHYPWLQIQAHLILEASANNQKDVFLSLFPVPNQNTEGSSRTLDQFRSFTIMYDGRIYNALELAVLGGHVDMVRLLRRSGWLPRTLLSSAATDGIHRLGQAAKQGDFQVVEALLEVLKLDFLDLSSDLLKAAKVKAFVTAASLGHENVVRICRKHMLDPLKSDGQGMCAFMRAIRNGRHGVVEYLLNQDPELQLAGCGVNANIEGYPLSLAASNGHLGIAKMLLQHGADPCSASSTAYCLVFQTTSSVEMSPTPLYAACANGHVAMVKFLLGKGAGPDSLSPTGILSQSAGPQNSSNGPTRRRIFYSDKRAYEIRDIISKVDVAQWQRPLAGAVVNGQLEVVKFLLQTDIDINAKDEKEDTALFLAIALGNADIMRMLIEAGATMIDVNHVKAVKELFQCASDPSRVNGIECLLEAGVCPDHLNMDEQSPLFCAATTGDARGVKLLIEAGANIERRDLKQNTPLVVACLHDNVEAASILIEAGADTTVKDTRGQSVLFQSFYKASLEVVQLLVNNGATINSTHLWGYTPLFAALERGHRAIVKLLLQNNADVNCRLSDAGSKIILSEADQAA